MAASLLAAFLVLRLSRSAGSVVMSAFAIAYALKPVVAWLRRRGLGATSAVLVLFAGGTLLLAAMLLYLVPAIGAELAKLPGFLHDLGAMGLPRLEQVLGRPVPASLREAVDALSAQGGGLQQALPGLAGVAARAIGGTASAVMAMVSLLVVPLLTFYLLRDHDVIVRFVRGLLPRRYEALVASRFAEVDAVLSGFIRGQLTVGAILTGLYALGLTVAGLDLAVVIGAVAGFGTMVPYLGPAVGAVLALLSLAVSWQGPWQLAVVAGTFAVAMTAEGIFITPRVVGGRVGLPALAVLLAVLVFGELFGFAGVLLAVPVTAALKVVARVVILRYRRSRLYGGSP